MLLLNGKLIAKEILADVANDVKQLRKKRTPLHLAVILVGRDPASVQYVKIKQTTAKELGIDVTIHRLVRSTTQKKLTELIRKLNKDVRFTGILVQMPLPRAINREQVVWEIDPAKDVDGFQMRRFDPPAPRAILEILRFYHIPIVRKKMLIVGEGFLVGRPLSVLATKHGAIVSTADSKTANLGLLVRSADIVVSATGVPKLIKRSWVHERQVIVDAGGGHINREVVGDVDFRNVAKKVKAISPVPGGVGPMTVAVLLRNVVKAAKLRSK